MIYRITANTSQVARRSRSKKNAQSFVGPVMTVTTNVMIYRITANTSQVAIRNKSKKNVQSCVGPVMTVTTIFLFISNSNPYE